MSGFDSIIVVDWAAGKSSGPTPRADAIWIGVATARLSEAPIYLPSRAKAESWLKTRLTAERAKGKRVLVCFDFPFAYPSGFGQALLGNEDPFALWQWFAEKVVEDEKGINNRFDLAGEINVRFGGKGPFWGNPLKRDIEGLARSKAEYDLAGFPEKRQCEQVIKGLFTCWQMSGVGSVGGQVMTGLPVLHRLREHFGSDLRVWPFEAVDAPIVLAETWPSLLSGPVKAAVAQGEIKDAAQVRLLSTALARLEPDLLAQVLHVPAAEDGAILGAEHVALLEQKLSQLSPPPLSNDCFALPAGVHWTPVDEALEMLRARLNTRASWQTVPLAEAVGQVLAQDVIARRSNPPEPNTAVDGYGFAYDTLQGEGPYKLPLIAGRSAAGAPFGADVPRGSAIRVLTGASLPQGVDTVILEEDTNSDGAQIAFRGPVKPFSNTRKAGEDVSRGDVVLSAARKITPADAALLSAVGIAQVATFKPLRVGVLSTGDELIEAGAPILDGQIYDANRPMLLALLESWGVEAVDLGRAPDDPADIRARMDRGAQSCDAILTSGGASAGDEDHMSALLAETGSLALWRIALKPGRPLALGIWDGVPVFGLPGNPVAALVCTLIFARPALNLLAGAGWSVPQGFMVPAAFEKNKKAGRREYLRARMRGGQVEVFQSEGSGRISGLSWAEGLVELPDEAMKVTQGTLVRYIPFNSF